MTATLHKLGAGSAAGLYYTGDNRREAKPDRRDEYYAKDGGGVWWTTGETVVRHGAAVDLASFRDLCAGIDPRSGKPLVRGAGPGHWAGIDICMTPGKSVSVLWASGTQEQRKLIEAAHHTAVDEALRFIINEGLVVVRSGAAGVNRHQPTDLIIGRFQHFTTREGDPNLHTHSVIMNVAGAPSAARSGRYASQHLTIDPEAIYRWQLAIGACFRATYSRELANTFGVQFRPAGQGQWEIAGIPESVLEAFSKRSAQILEFAGANASPAQRQIAALATRQAKDLVPTGAELETRWRDELSALDADPWAAALDRHSPPSHEVELDRSSFDPSEIAATGPVAIAASRLFRHESVVERKDLLQAALEQAGLQGLGPEAVMAELGELERTGVLIVLGDDAQSGRWTTPGIAASEAAMLRAAERADERDWITREALDVALSRSPHLADEQRQALIQSSGRDGVVIIEAGAGTGKTTLAKALVEAARESGLRMLGLSPAWVAADELAASTGIPAQAIARWRHDQASGKAPALDAATMIILDEAGMVGTKDMAAVLTAARDAGAKVVLLGDRRQLASVSGASALRAVRDVVERVATLDNIRRQRVDWQQAATVVMARGDAESGLRAYADHGRIAFVSGVEAAQERVIAAWRQQRAKYGDDVLIITRRNDDAAALNRKARQALRDEGLLGPDLVELRALDRQDKPTKLALAVGDSLRFGETLPQHSIRNGHRATVEAIRQNHAGEIELTLVHQDGRRLELPWQALAREPLFRRKPAPPKIVHAHAGTSYSVQGRTAAASVLYIARSTDAREVYVGLSRHRHDARIVVEQDRLDALCRRRQADTRMPASAQAIRERLFSEAAQYREKTNVIDHAHDRIAFIADGTVRNPVDREPAWMSRALRSLQRLRNALRSLGPDQWPARLVDAVRGLGSAWEMGMSPDIQKKVDSALGRNRSLRTRERNRTIER